MPCGASSVASGRSATRLSMVARTSFMSCRLAPSTARPIGTPCPSVSTLRLTPLLPRSVGFGPVFFPPERCLRHRSIHAQPTPVNALQFIELLDACEPELLENTGLDPRLEAVVGGGLGTQVGLIQGFPLAARAQDIEDGVSAAAVGDARTTTPKAVAIEMDGDERLKHGPEGIGDTEGGGRRVIGRTHARARSWCRCCTHTIRAYPNNPAARKA